MKITDIQTRIVNAERIKLSLKKTPQSISLGLNVERYYTASNNIRK